LQISDIVVGQEPNVNAKDVLLRWARRTTARYPGVRVNDFTASWRDGLAFSAIVHRNRYFLLPAKQKLFAHFIIAAFCSNELANVPLLQSAG